MCEQTMMFSGLWTNAICLYLFLRWVTHRAANRLVISSAPPSGSKWPRAYSMTLSCYPSLLCDQCIFCWVNISHTGINHWKNHRLLWQTSNSFTFTPHLESLQLLSKLTFISVNHWFWVMWGCFCQWGLSVWTFCCLTHFSLTLYRNPPMRVFFSRTRTNMNTCRPCSNLFNGLKMWITYPSFQSPLPFLLCLCADWKSSGAVKSSVKKTDG